MRRTHATVLVAALVLLAGCGGAGIGSNQQSAPDAGSVDADVARGGANAPAEDVARESGSGSGSGSGGQGGTVEQVRNRQLIRTAQVRLRVGNYDAARDRLGAAAERRGGFVGDASARVHTTEGGNYTTGTVTFRVPNDEFEAFLEDVNATGTVLRSQQNTEDVTDRLVDIEARLNNLRAQRDQLRQIYRRANTTEDVLRVQERLAEVQTEIERLEAKKASLERRVALSTVTVEIREPRPEPEPEPEPPEWYETPLVEAFLSSVDGVVLTAQALGVVAAYAAPYLLTFVAPPLVGVVLVWRRWGGRGDGDAGETIADADTDTDAGTDTETDADRGGRDATDGDRE